jgi:hypothetical protein
VRLRRSVAALLLVVVACSPGDDDRVEGVVIEVVGDLTSVESFTLRLPDGTDRVFEPAPGTLFDGDAPLSHLQDHLRSGAGVEVRYRSLEGGTLEAFEVGDA